MGVYVSLPDLSPGLTGWRVTGAVTIDVDDGTCTLANWDPSV